MSCLIISRYSILNKIKLVSHSPDVHLQWVPSCVDFYGNEMADKLAKDCEDTSTFGTSIMFFELIINKKTLYNLSLLTLRTH